MTGKEIHLWVSSSCFDRCREECAFSLSIGFFADNDKKKGQLSFVDSILLICLTLSSYLKRRVYLSCARSPSCGLFLVSLLFWFLWSLLLLKRKPFPVCHSFVSWPSSCLPGLLELKWILILILIYSPRFLFILILLLTLFSKERFPRDMQNGNPLSAENDHRRRRASRRSQDLHAVCKSCSERVA